MTRMELCAGFRLLNSTFMRCRFSVGMSWVFLLYWPIGGVKNSGTDAETVRLKPRRYASRSL